MHEVLLIIGGVLNLLFVIFHAGFWRMGGLNWRRELPKTNPVNRGATQAMNLMLIYTFACFAAVSFIMAASSVPRAMVTSFSIVIGGFFAVRAALQPAFFKPRWRGNVLLAACVVTAACYFLTLLMVIKGVH
jgi:hypothetical protein